jgi:hypothetical protein
MSSACSASSAHSPASLDVTRRYVELLDEDLREVHRRASPMDLLRRQ